MNLYRRFARDRAIAKGATGVVRVHGRIAADFSTALAEIAHPSTGIVKFMYPLSWLGDSEYLVREIVGDGIELPSWLKGSPPNRRLRVRHLSEDVCDAAFIASAYGAPCVDGEHPGIWHAEYAHIPTCGMLGTSHEIRESVNGLGPVPYVPYLCSDPNVAQRILDGANESSLAYNYGLEWAPEGSDYDARHVLVDGAGLVNHLLVGIQPGGSRGGTRARRAQDSQIRVWWDFGREQTQRLRCFSSVIPSPPRYDGSERKPMAIKFKPSPAAALALGLAADLATAKDAVLEIAEEDTAAVKRTVDILMAALQASVEENATMATQMGEMQAVAQESAATIADMKESVAAADSLLVRDAVAKAGLLGVTIACDKDGNPSARKDGDKEVPVTVADVYTQIVLEKFGKSALDTIPSASRTDYAKGMVQALLRQPNGKSRQNTAADSASPSPPAAVDPRFRKAFLGRSPKPNH